TDNHQKDEQLLLANSDMLTLLLAVLIVLFAAGEGDVAEHKDFEEVCETEFEEGGGVVDGSSRVVADDVPMKEEDDKDEEEDTDEAKAIEEYQQLKKMQEEMEGYIEENSLADTLGTALTAEGLLVTVRTDITFDSGSSTVKSE